MWISRKAAAYSQRKPHFRRSTNRAGDRREANVIDFRIRAPDAATGYGNLEFARQIVELVVADKETVCLQY